MTETCSFQYSQSIALDKNIQGNLLAEENINNNHKLG